MFHIKEVVFLFIVYVTLQDAARILGYFPVPSISHQKVFRQLTYELAKKGHSVVVITPDPAYNQEDIGKNITEIDVHAVSYNLWKNLIEKVNGKTSSLEILEAITNVLLDIVERQLHHKDVLDIINRKEKFDLLLIEACSPSALILSHIFKVPVIQVSSFGSIYPNLNVIGAYTNPLLYPEILSVKIHSKNVWEKIENIWFYAKVCLLFRKQRQEEFKMLKKIFGSNAPTLSELEKKVEMLFLNTYAIWDGNRPVPPGLIYIGGIYRGAEQKIPMDIEKYLDSSINGVIYMSLGTNVQPSFLPLPVKEIFLKVFSKLPYDVLLKWDTEEIIGKPKNVKLFKWLPQPDILKHPNIKLFIGQGGFQSTEEAISAAVPLIAFPMLADQWYNAEKYVHFKIGIKLNIENISEDILKNSIASVIKDQSYKENIKKLRSMMLDQPESAAHRAVWWVEHVLQHGGARHLRTRLADVSWTEYLMLDVVAVLFLAFVVSLFVMIYGTKLLLSTIKRIYKKYKNKHKTD